MNVNISSNTSGNYSNGDYSDCIQYVFITNTIITGALCALGIMGNRMAFDIFRKIGHRNSSTTLSQALALMDSLVLLFTLLCYTMNICGLDSCHTDYYCDYSILDL